MENHALYIFCEDHYAEFEEMLGRPIDPGAFSENLTYRGPGEMDLRIGDQLHIGTARVELVSPRVPCYKLAHFLQAGDDFPARFSATGRTGVYCRVIKPGIVEPDDAVEIIRTDDRNAAIAELNDVMTAPRPAADTVVRVLASPDLRTPVRAAIENRLTALGLSHVTLPQRARIVGRVKETPSVVSLTFDLKLPEGSRRKPGQFVTVGVEDETGRTHSRCYSLSAGPFADDAQEACRISVKREAESANAVSVSNLIHDRVSVGDVCTVYPPAGDFVLPDRLSGPVAFIAGGIGITPILPQVKHLARLGHEGPVTLIYVARAAADLAFLDDLGAAVAALPAAELRLFVTGPGPASGGAMDATRSRPDLAAEIAGLDAGTELFVCGPPSMIEAVRAAHAGLGRANAALHFELFAGAAVAEQLDSAAETARVTIGPDGRVATWRNGDGPLLAWIERTTAYRPTASCRSGMCRTCAATLVRGRAVYPSSVTPPAPSEVLLCCAMPASDIEIALPNGTAIAPEAVGRLDHAG